MKKLILPLALLALTIALPSCDNDDDSPRVVNPTAVVTGGVLSAYPESLIPEDGKVALDTITEIADSVFAGQSKLKELTAPKLTKIGKDAFKGSGLVRLALSSVPTSVAAGAFAETSQDKDLVIPAEQLEAFRDFAEANGFKTINGAAIPAKVIPPVIEGGKLISYHESAVPEDGVVTLDEKIVEIGAAAFAGNTKVKEIHASKVTKIDSAAFSGATSLALVDFSASANPPAATADAFYNTPSTKAIKLPASPNALNWFEFAARHDFGFFQGLEATAKSNYTAKDGVLTAIDGKKLGVQGLLVLPESVTKIADGVGFADKGVKLVYAPGVTEMGSGVFNQAENLRGIIAPRLKKIGTMAFVQTAALPVINFPELTEIGPLSFDNHDNRARLELTLLRLPKIQKIGNGAFTDRFGSLTTFILGAKPTYNTAAAKAPVIDDDAFEDWMIIDGGFDDYLFATFKGRRAAGATLLVPAANLADYGAEGAQWEGFTIKVLK